MVYNKGAVSEIYFETKLFAIGSWTILLLPKSESNKLPSRGMVMIEGTIDDVLFKSTLEPDGRGSHWMRVDQKLLKSIGKDAGNSVTVEMRSTKDWIEPEVPEDVDKALKTAPQNVQNLWKDITPMARWDWIRWIRATNNPDTRKKHITVALSKMSRGERRPCCFNRNLCTDPSVSYKWLLLEPAQAK